MKKLLTVILVLIYSLSFAQIISDMGDFDNQGVPGYLDGQREEVNPRLLDNISLLLPDGVSLQENNPALYNRNTLSFITLQSSGDVYLSFISEGADFTSSVGFYAFSGRPPMSKYMVRNMKTVFPNVSAVGSGGGLQRGDRVKLGHFEAGTSIGFFLIADGFKYGRVMSAGKDVFFTENRFNPETNDNLKKHTVLLYDQPSDRYVLLFEDFNRQGGSDGDFNDAIFVISTASKGTLSTEGAPVIQEETEILTKKPDNNEQDKKIVICHYPHGNRDNPQELEINESAWPAHRDHGDQIGPCAVTEPAETEVAILPDIEGSWNLECMNTDVEVQKTNNGIRVRSGNSGKWFGYTKTNETTYTDEYGNSYQFENDSIAVWTGSRELGPFGLIKVKSGKKITICHYPPGNRDNPQEITISENAWPAHEKHGDSQGGCSQTVTTSQINTSYDVAGSWKLEGRNQINIIRISPTGLEARSSRNNRWFLYTKEGDNTYKDDQGNTYLFDSDATGEWISSNGKTVIRIVKN